MSNMLKSAVVNVKYNGVSSDEWSVGKGARQGGVLSALLFSFYIEEVILEVQSLDIGCSLGPCKTNILCYADDIVLLAPSLAGLQVLVDTVCAGLRRLNMTVNCGKSAYIQFYRNRGKVFDGWQYYNG